MPRDLSARPLKRKAYARIRLSFRPAETSRCAIDRCLYEDAGKLSRVAVQVVTRTPASCREWLCRSSRRALRLVEKQCKPAKVPKLSVAPYNPAAFRLRPGRCGILSDRSAATPPPTPAAFRLRPGRCGTSSDRSAATPPPTPVAFRLRPARCGTSSDRSAATPPRRGGAIGRVVPFASCFLFAACLCMHTPFRAGRPAKTPR